MKTQRETTWSSSLATASSFLGLMVAVVFGVLASLSNGSGAMECLTLGTVCGVSFALHLKAA